MREHGEVTGEMAGGLRLLRRGDDVDECAVVDASSASRGLDGETDCQVGLARAGRG